MLGSSANRLRGESSPYLLAHADNPVDWYPWIEEALERARTEDRPIFLSIGYHTCHWCHVMEHESFSDASVAELMNRHFVNIKVDREERPDLDEIYMTATQLLTGHGGWPMSVFLTPDLKPFFAGTYFPPNDRQGMPGFPRVLSSLAEAWNERRQDVETQAEEVARAVRRTLERDLDAGPPAVDPGPLARQSLDRLTRAFDPVCGGFGAAPKFPTPSRLLLLEEMLDEDPQAGEMLARTLDRMARGGLFDQLGGGFHRYATDREWRIPHFEKMLYDNALLLALYARRAARDGDEQSRRTVESTVGFLVRELRDPVTGAFWSALDADSDGREGAYYVWNRDELSRLLGEEEDAFLAPLLGFDGPPFFDSEDYVLHLPAPLGEQAARRRVGEAELVAQIERAVQPLRAARQRRSRPPTDDKVLADWNGMAVAGLAVAGRLLARREWLDLAVAAARFVLESLRTGGGFHHSWRAGRLGPAAFLSDYVWTIHGLLALDEALPEGDWRDHAIELAAEQEERLAAPGGGYFSVARREDLLARSREAFDGAVPAANAVASWNWVDLAQRTGDVRWATRSARLLEALGGLSQRHPGAGDSLVVAALRHRACLAESAARPEIGTSPVASEALAAVEVSLEGVIGREGEDWRELRLRLVPSAGWRIAGPDGSGPPELSAEGVELEAPRWPPEAVQGVTAPLTLRLRVGAISSGTARLVLRYGACDRMRCLAPARRELPVPA